MGGVGGRDADFNNDKVFIRDLLLMLTSTLPPSLPPFLPLSQAPSLSQDNIAPACSRTGRSPPFPSLASPPPP